MFNKKDPLNPNVTIKTIVTLPNWEEKIIERTVDVNDLDNFEQMEDEAIAMWNDAVEMYMKQMLKKKEKVLTKPFSDMKIYKLNGKKSINIIWKTNFSLYERQRIKNKKSNRVLIPIDDFFDGKKRWIGYVSKNVEKEAVEDILSSSYRNVEKRIWNKLSKESIRNIVKEKWIEAKKLEKINKKSIILEDKSTKDASNQNETYKKSKWSLIRNLFSKILWADRFYVMADWVGIQWQWEDWDWKDWKWIKECKLACVLKQEDDKLKEVGILSTWERISWFKNMLEWFMLWIVWIAIPIVIISDWAKWIRNLRNKIPCLKKAIWILDWFHVKEKVMNTLKTVDIEEESKTAQDIISFLWIWDVEVAKKLLNKLPLSTDKEKKEQQEISIKNTIKYLINQREWIINYQACQMKWYIVWSGYVEKKNDLLIKNRMVRQKRMRWWKEWGEAMIQLLTAQMNGRLGELYA